MLLSVRLGTVKGLQMAATNNPPLMPGKTGAEVAALQEILCDLGYALSLSFKKTGNADAIFGDETKRAVMAFQRDHALKVDGIAGRDVLNALDEIIIKSDILEKHTAADVAHAEARDGARPPNRRTRIAT